MDAFGWEWDETLYSGSAPHYSAGRMPYPPELADAVRDTLGLEGGGRLLDVGCGPGSLTMLLAPLFEATVAVDADPDMIAEAARRARDAGVATIEWWRLRAEDLPAGLGTFRVAAFAQSFHWMDQPLVARCVRGMLEANGAWVHVHATTHRGVPSGRPLPYPPPPWDHVDALVGRYLGPVRRAGQGTLPAGTRGGEEDVMRQAGFTGPTRVEVGGGHVVQRTVDDVVSAVFSLSSSAPHLFADRIPDFEAELRGLLREASPGGWFCEVTQQVDIVVWHR